MTNIEWKACMVSIVEGVEHELRPAALTMAKVALTKFCERLNQKRIKPSRRSFERELEAFLQSTPALRAAAQRHIRKTAPPLIRAAVAALGRAKEILAQTPNNRMHRTPR